MPGCRCKLTGSGQAQAMALHVHAAAAPHMRRPPALWQAARQQIDLQLQQAARQGSPGYRAGWGVWAGAIFEGRAQTAARLCHRLLQTDAAGRTLRYSRPAWLSKSVEGKVPVSSLTDKSLRQQQHTGDGAAGRLATSAALGTASGGGSTSGSCRSAAARPQGCGSSSTHRLCSAGKPPCTQASGNEP